MSERGGEVAVDGLHGVRQASWLVVRALRLIAAWLVVAAIAGAGAGSAQAYIYWGVGGLSLIDGGGTTIARANQDGSVVNHTFISGLSAPDSIAISSDHIYWSTEGTGSIGRANLDGTDPDPTWISDAGALTLAVAGNSIYWVGSGTLMRANLSDGSDQTTVLSKLSGPYAIAADLTQSTPAIYFASSDEVYELNGSGEKLVATFPGATFIWALTVAHGIAYAGYDQAGPAVIASEPIGGTSPNANTLPVGGNATGIAVEGSTIYWTDNGDTSNTIDRATIGTNGSFANPVTVASEPGGPWGIAVDTTVDPTTTQLSCAPSQIAVGVQPTTCTVTVSDPVPGSPPTGTVSFSGGPGISAINGPNVCALVAFAGTHTCGVGLQATVAETATITASYAGDTLHQASSGTTSICAGTTTQCSSSTGSGGGGSGTGSGSGAGGGSGGGSSGGGRSAGGTSPSPKLACVVPKLVGRTLSQARSLLRGAHCSLGKVTAPKQRKRGRALKLVVRSTKPGAGAKRAKGAPVAVTLVSASKSKHNQH